jgi:hypothetical protein
MYTFWWNFEFSFRRYGTLFVKLKAISRMSRSNLLTPKPIHFKLSRVIEYDGLTICILCGEISIFHSRVMGLYSWNWRWFFVCRALIWEPLGQFTLSFAELLDMMILRSVYILVKFLFFIKSYGTLFVKLKAIFRMSRSNLRTPWPIHFKLCRVIGYDCLMVLVHFGEILIFQSRVMGLSSSNWRQLFVCRALTWEPLGEFLLNFTVLLDVVV